MRRAIDRSSRMRLPAARKRGEPTRSQQEHEEDGADRGFHWLSLPGDHPVDDPRHLVQAEGLGEDAVEVTDEVDEALAQIVEGREAGALEQPADKDTEPELDPV